MGFAVLSMKRLTRCRFITTHAAEYLPTARIAWRISKDRNIEIMLRIARRPRYHAPHRCTDARSWLPDERCRDMKLVVPLSCSHQYSDATKPKSQNWPLRTVCFGVESTYCTPVAHNRNKTNRNHNNLRYWMNRRITS